MENSLANSKDLPIQRHFGNTISLKTRFAEYVFFWGPPPPRSLPIISWVTEKNQFVCYENS